MSLAIVNFIKSFFTPTTKARDDPQAYWHDGAIAGENIRSVTWVAIEDVNLHAFFQLQ